MPDSCVCLCDAPNLPPTCGFTSTDSVTVDFFFNATVDEFNSAWFLSALSKAVRNETYTFLYAKNLSTFNASMVRIVMPGYTVPRLMESIAYRDQWVITSQLSSAFPQPALLRPSSYEYDYVLYESGSRNVVVSVIGVAWVAAAALMVLCCVGCEHCFLSNTEEGHYDMEYNFGDAQARKKEDRRRERLHRKVVPHACDEKQQSSSGVN